MTATDDSADEQKRLVLTAHPLQRVGAFALAALAGDSPPENVTPAEFDAALECVTGDAVRAALVRDSKGPAGFWLKVSYSFFPNSPMNHPSNSKRTDPEITEAIRQWRALPGRPSWPPVDCVLCSRQAVGFFGKRDVPLAESESYRNSTPRGHHGMALCQPCLQSFYALPYGVRLTGGSSIALHSWDDDFLQHAVSEQVDHNRMIAATGDAGARQGDAREVVALVALRTHRRPVGAAVDLLVFNNNNRGQLLDTYSLDQPLAEWLRRTQRLGGLRTGFAELVRAHAGQSTPGLVSLARNAFRTPARIVTAGHIRLLRCLTRAEQDRSRAEALATLLGSFATEVMLMTEKDLAEIARNARNVAALLYGATSAGNLRSFRAMFRETGKLRRWLTASGVQWAVKPPEGGVGPLVTERCFELLFDPAMDNPAWFHRDMFLVGVLQELNTLGWKPEKPGEDTDEDFDPLDIDSVKFAPEEDAQ
ncbi:hypothetical protein PUR71_10080 [Streptomyces sp. SP17BM10]|uniref:hypothetical protein n=1 Tax=Streptomyces sp. SP17BM10 TaxID=3002530 RepID=UPI002E7646FF|nr:hypothetical protein [Streptomyces sp. SP17BM10]MEE1783258.1 hypothetical protein [Streptomyces sp. SP17BM10]